jgi:uncharacterized protein
MSGGLIALLDDIAAIAKVAAASLDDVAAQTAKAGAKAAGIVIDDAAVTPRYVVGFAAERELPIIARIAMGSLKNKLLVLLPIAVLLYAFAPWAITPLLMLGGAFLCFEGYEKVHGLVTGHAAHGHAEHEHADDPKALEDTKVAGAIRTDMILSAEIMAIALSTITVSGWVMQAVVLAVVGIAITVVVYGTVALIVKADDVGVALARRHDGIVGAFGRGLVAGMPGFLKALSLVGTIAMLWVGGGILLHGLAEFGWKAPEYGIASFARAIGAATGPLEGFVAWFVSAGIAAVVGLVVGVFVAKGVGLVGGMLPKKT